MHKSALGGIVALTHLSLFTGIAGFELGMQLRGLEGIHKQGRGIHLQSTESNLARYDWHPKPTIYRSNNGIPRPVGELKALGNAVVPAVVAKFLAEVNS